MTNLLFVGGIAFQKHVRYGNFRIHRPDLLQLPQPVRLIASLGRRVDVGYSQACPIGFGQVESVEISLI